MTFFVVGAWIPLAGCITCALAINNSSNNQMIRITLLIITALCNAVQFCLVMFVIGAARYTAFMHDDSLRQVHEQMGGVAFLSGTPTWIALVMPVTILMNAMFAIGAFICAVYETSVMQATYAKLKQTADPAEADAQQFTTQQ
jgi:hypothetical protein